MQMISIHVNTNDPEALQRKLFTDYKIEVPVARKANDFYMRYSINAFNTTADLDALYEAVREIKKQGKLIS